jgi:3-dehydroquinate synthase
MSASFDIRTSEGSYRVEVGTGLLRARLQAAQKSHVILCDRALQSALPQGMEAIVIEATEEAKDLARIPDILGKLKEKNTHRGTLLYAVGGGIVQDIACFAASIYMRGMKWVYFPTTLLGMADSCIGGKSSINAAGYKNLAGTFHPPEAVFIDPGFAETLTAEQKIAGLCEAVKICFAHTGDYFERYLALAPSPLLPSPALGQVISLSLACKKWFIEIDEFDRKERQLLNFGHTFGHAIEAACDYAIPHGIAVGVGMLCALDYARQTVSFTWAGEGRVKRLSEYVENLLAPVEGLGTALARIPASLAFKKFTADKKHEADGYRIIVPDAEGYLERVSLPRTQTTQERIEAIFAAAGRSV